MVKWFRLKRKVERRNPQYYLMEAKKVAKNSNCETTHWGAVLVNWRGKIIGRGHNYVPHDDLFRYCRPCIRVDIRSGTQQELCGATHAEVNCIEDAIAEHGVDNVLYCEMYLYGYSEIEGTPNKPIVMLYYPCMTCSIKMMQYKVDKIWFYRPVARTPKERDWLPHSVTEKFLPDFITGNQFWFHPGIWLGLEGHEFKFDTESVIKLAGNTKETVRILAPEKDS